MKDRTSTPLSDVKIHVKLELSALWATTVVCYIYGDLGTQAGLLAAALSVAIPSVMVVVSLLVKPPVCRWLNIVFGTAYTVIMLATMPGGWLYYLFLGSIEVALTLLIVWYAWYWPRREA